VAVCIERQKGLKAKRQNFFFTIPFLPFFLTLACGCIMVLQSLRAILRLIWGLAFFINIFGLDPLVLTVLAIAIPLGAVTHRQGLQSFWMRHPATIDGAAQYDVPPSFATIKPDSPAFPNLPPFIPGLVLNPFSAAALGIIGAGGLGCKFSPTPVPALRANVDALIAWCC